MPVNVFYSPVMIAATQPVNSEQSTPHTDTGVDKVCVSSLSSSYLSCIGCSFTLVLFAIKSVVGTDQSRTTVSATVYNVADPASTVESQHLSLVEYLA